MSHKLYTLCHGEYNTTITSIFRLVCEVHYTTPAGFEESFRKFFKFQVLKPLDVKTKFYNAETDEVYLEAQVRQNDLNRTCSSTPQ